MAGNIFDFKAQAVADPFVAPAGYTINGNPSKIFNTGIKYWTLSSGVNTFFVDNLILTGDVISSKISLGTVNSTPAGASLLNSSGNGYTAIASNVNTVRIFRVAAWVMDATVRWTSVSSIMASEDTIELRTNKTTGLLEVYKNGSILLNASSQSYTDATYSVDRAAAHSRFGYVSTLESVYTPAQTLTIATDLTPSASRTDTCVGFADGAAIISFAGVSVNVTIASGSFTWTVPMLSNGVNWPRLPSTGTTITLTQGGISANTKRNITLPAGYNTLRVGDVDGGAVANFAGIVTDDPKFLGYHITLTTDDTGYNVTSGGYRVFRDGDVGADTNTLPRTDPWFQQNTTSGLITAHNVTLTAEGIVVGDPEILTVGTILIGGTTTVTVDNFSGTVNAGTFDGVALVSANDTTLVFAPLEDGEVTYRPGIRTLSLTDGTDTATSEEEGFAPLGWSYYTIQPDFVQAINGVETVYLPVGWAVDDFILSPNAPSSGKTTTVTDAGVITSNVGTQELFLVDAATGLAKAFDIVTTAGAGSIGGGGGGSESLTSRKLIGSKFR